MKPKTIRTATQDAHFRRGAEHAASLADEDGATVRRVAASAGVTLKELRAAKVPAYDLDELRAHAEEP